jgi:uncharacterized small protein (DUF1192 family)
MCKNHEHRYTIEISLSKGGARKEDRIMVDAIGVAAAIAKADYVAAERHPDADWVEFRIFHSGYRGVEGALEHGAIPPNENTLSDSGKLRRMSVAELQGRIQEASKELARRANLPKKNITRDLHEYFTGASDWSFEVSRDLILQVKKTLEADGIIRAIKFLRENTGWDLKRAKGAIDGWRAVDWEW